MASFNSELKNGCLKISLDGICILNHSPESPAFFVGFGSEDVVMYRGNFKITDKTHEKTPLRNVEKTAKGFRFFYGEDELNLSFGSEGAAGSMEFSSPKTYTRFWMRIPAEKTEHYYGLGEQMSHFNLRGKLFPIWSSEPGVGRNKNTYVTWQSDVNGMAGGDYWTTNYPQPSYLSQQGYYFYGDSYAYAEFDFRSESFTQYHVWEVPKRVLFWRDKNYKELISQISLFFGRQEPLPQWAGEGFMLGIQGGWEKLHGKVQLFKDYGVPLSAVWVQDWEGIRMTSFGQRLMWNWQRDEKRYPKFIENLRNLKKEGVRFMAYANCYLAVDGPLFAEADKLGYLAKNKDGAGYAVDFGEFYAGIPDFTREEVCQWFAERILCQEFLDIGIEGWMADFGEYLPTDCVLAKGDAMKLHNEWPTLWAKVNDIALRKRGKRGEALFFMRASGAHSQKYCPLLWAGDQSVDFTKDDGLASVIPATLSAGISGFAFNHSDTGGYTSLYGNVRTPELNFRWIEFNAFTGIMRSHEGNRPYDNSQIYDSPAQMVHLGKMARIFRALAPYREIFNREAASKGLPLMRPLFLEYPSDEKSYEIEYQYMLGTDILVAPVWQAEQSSWDVYLPPDNWTHLWTGKEYKGGSTVSVEAGIGKIPVFYKKTSPHAPLFDGLKHL